MDELPDFLNEIANKDAFEALYQTLCAKKMIAFVGAGCSVPLGYPTWKNLLRELIERCKIRQPSRLNYWNDRAQQLDEPGTNLLTLANECKETLGPEYLEILEQRFSAKKPEYSPEHEILINLPFHRFLTTNYDPCLDNAWTKIHHCPATSFTYTDIGRFAKFAETSDETQGWILHCHGRCHPPEEIILTEKDYQQHYKKGLEYTRTLEALFQANPVFFVGFSFSDADFGQIPRVLVALFEGRGQEHYALLPTPGDIEGEESRRYDLYTQYKIRTIFYPVGPNNDHSARTHVLEVLLARWEKDAKQKKPIEYKKVLPKFANREQELKFIQIPKARFQLIDAPAGYGKSVLLREAEEDFRAREDWACGRVDFSENEMLNSSPEGLAARIVEAVCAERIVLTKSKKVTRRIATRIARHCNTLKKKKLVLLLDSVDKLSPAMNTYLKNEIIPGLSSSLELPGIQLYVVVAGRYVGEEWAAKPLTSKRAPIHVYSWNLSPFDREIIQRMIQDIQQTSVGEILDWDKAEQIAKKVDQISGGHPDGIARILYELGIEPKGFAFDLEEQFSPDECEDLFDKHMEKYIVPMIIGDLPPDLADALETLSVFRHFNEETLQFLINRGEIISDNHVAAGKLLQKLAQTRHVRELGNGFYADEITRRVFLARVRFKRPKHYKHVNRLAVELYDKWIHSRNIDGENLLKDITGDTQVNFIAEYLYHLLCSLEDHSQSEIAAEFETRLADCVRTMTHPFRKEYAVRSLEDKLLRKDTELIETMYDLMDMDTCQRLAHVTQWWQEICQEEEKRR